METQITQNKFKVDQQVEIISTVQSGLSNASIGKRGSVKNIDEDEDGPLKYVVHLDGGDNYFLGDRNIKSI